MIFQGNSGREWLYKKNCRRPHENFRRHYAKPTVWGKNPAAEKMLTLLALGIFLKTPKIVGKSSADPVGVFSMRPNPPKCHIRQTKT